MLELRIPLKFNNTVVNADLKPRVKSGDVGHKKAILSGSIRSNDWQEGDSVVVKSSGAYGWVVDILNLERFDLVEWTGLKPLFIEVYLLDENESVLVHPADLIVWEQSNGTVPSN